MVDRVGTTQYRAMIPKSSSPKQAVATPSLPASESWANLSRRPGFCLVEHNNLRLKLLNANCSFLLMVSFNSEVTENFIFTSKNSWKCSHILMMKLNFHDKQEKLELAIYHRKIFLLEILKSSEARENENCPFRVEVFSSSLCW